MVQITRGQYVYAALTLIMSFVLVFVWQDRPTYTDAYYHYNAAVQVVNGNGFTDEYFWTYIGAPDSLPSPSHLYWMPGTSMISATSMAIFGDNYRAAQIPLALLLWGTVIITLCVAHLLKARSSQAYIAATITLFGGFFLPFYGATDTITPYAFFGGLCLLCVGLAIDRQQMRYWLAAGLLAGAGHLIRSDGLLLLLVGWCCAFFPTDYRSNFITKIKRRIPAVAIFTAAYVLVMLPWYVRNMNAIGAPLPVGGTQSIWFTEYNDIFNYPPDASPDVLQEDLSSWLAARVDSLGMNGALGTFLAVEGYVILGPFILFALWQRRRDKLLRPVWVFAAGIHLAMTLVFPFPGMRGGLLHGVSALIPFWSVLGLLGLESAVRWLAARRRWNARQAVTVFSFAALMLIVPLSVFTVARSRVSEDVSPVYDALRSMLPEGARVFSHDPAALYYFTGMGGGTLPNETPDVIRDMAVQFDIGYILLQPPDVTRPLLGVPDNPPEFFELIDLQIDGAYLYAIVD